MQLADLLLWHNLVFVLPIVASVLYVLALGFSGVDHASEGPAEPLHPLGLDHGIEHSLALEPHAATDAPAGVSHVLDFLGVGRAPLAIVLPTLGLSWGFVGLAANTALSGVLPSPLLRVAVAVIMATVIAVVLTSRLARLIARLLPRTQTYGVDPEDLIGTVGVASSPGISPRFGEALVYDRFNNQHTVACRARLEAGPIPTGARILLIDYEPQSRLFVVESYPE